MLRDIRGNEVSEGDIIVCQAQQVMVDGIVAEIGAPMVQHGPQGQVVLQKLQVIVMYNFVVPVPANQPVPLAVLEKSESEVAQKALAHLKAIVEKAGTGAGAGNVVVMQ